MAHDRPADSIEKVTARLDQLELTLIEVVTALGLLVGELALRNDLALTKAGIAEEALDHGWQALIGLAREGDSEGPLAPVVALPRVLDSDWSDAARLAAIAPGALRQAMQETGAAVGAIYAVAEDQDAHLAAFVGYPDEVMEGYRSVPADADLPVAAVVRSGEAVWFAERDEIVDRYPHLREAHERTETALGEAGVQGAVVPLIAHGRVAAVVIVGFTIRGGPHDPAELEVVRARIIRSLAGRQK